MSTAHLKTSVQNLLSGVYFSCLDILCMLDDLKSVNSDYSRHVLSRALSFCTAVSIDQKLGLFSLIILLNLLFHDSQKLFVLCEIFIMASWHLWWWFIYTVSKYCSKQSSLGRKVNHPVGTPEYPAYYRIINICVLFIILYKT